MGNWRGILDQQLSAPVAFCARLFENLMQLGTPPLPTHGKNYGCCLMTASALLEAPFNRHTCQDICLLDHPWAGRG